MKKKFKQKSEMKTSEVCFSYDWVVIRSGLMGNGQWWNWKGGKKNH